MPTAAGLRYAGTMRIELSTSGLHLATDDAGIVVDAARPAATFSVAGRPAAWTGDAIEVRNGELVCRSTGGVLQATLRAAPGADGTVEVRGTLRNEGSRPLRLERFVLLASDHLRVGAGPAHWRVYRNGYQSWSGTHTLGCDERDRDFGWRFARVGVTDARHRAPSAPGHVRSDAIGAIGETHTGAAVAFGFTGLDTAFAFVEVDAGSAPPRLACWVDFDGVTLAPGASTPEVVLHVASVRGGAAAGWQALQAVARSVGTAMAARGRGRPHPAGWCSWYYYFEKVTEADVMANLAVLAGDGRDGPRFGCAYVMVDDGHQSEIGDWLATAPAKFPSGMARVAARIRAAGFDAGLWWAPFIAAPGSEVARAHPEWLVRDARGRAIVALVNPAWGLTKPMRVLDTTHPEVLAHLESVARTIGSDWGYAIQKLDFLYAAALPGMRHDPDATRAQSLRRGLEAIRRGAGDDAFLLGCGCPLGPAVGVVDAMRIGADVTPYWTNWLARRVLLDSHGLATRHAVLNTLTRAVLDGLWWLNDPDCLMLRDSETRLTEEEVRLMATVFAMTNGMLVLSDRLDRLPAARLELLARARRLAGGTPTLVDLFAEREPRVLVSEHPDRVDVAVLNLGDTPAPRTATVAGVVREDGDGDRFELWTGAPVRVRDGVADFGVVPAHAARVVSFARSDAG